MINIASRIKVADIYSGRLEEIEKQIKTAVFKKQWGKLKQLRIEKKNIEQCMRNGG